MAFFDFGKVCLFSDVSGVILFNGSPATQAVIKRTYEYNKSQGDQTQTDQNGRFNFNSVSQFSIAKFLPIEFVVAQSLTVEYQGKEYIIWTNTKRSFAKNSELGGQALQLTCELTTERSIYTDFGSILHTSCKW